MPNIPLIIENWNNLSKNDTKLHLSYVKVISIGVHIYKNENIAKRLIVVSQQV